MFKQFLTALLYEMNHFLVKHETFFDGDESAREKALDSVRMPAPFKHYMAKVSAENYLGDMKLAVDYLQSPKDTRIEGNMFFQALTGFFTGAFARKLDMLTSEYYIFDSKDQTKVVDQLIKSDTRLAMALKELLLGKTYQQLSAAIQTLAERTASVPVIVVQTPDEMDVELKKEVRKHFTDKNALYFPVFQINRKLIGGLRVFQGGETQDHSWLSRVHALTR